MQGLKKRGLVFYTCFMKLFQIVSSTFLLILFAGCNKRQTTKAKIFERREAGENKLAIKYSFLANGKQIVDSTIIDNKSLNGDSVTIKFNPQNPTESTIDSTQ